MIEPGIGHFLIFVTDYHGYQDNPKINPRISIITDASGNPFETIEDAQNYINLIKNKYSEYQIAEVCYGPEPPIAVKTHIEPIQKLACYVCFNSFTRDEIAYNAIREALCPACYSPLNIRDSQ
jgi:hypothetical protein